MLQFFHGWRRKAGVVSLLLACVFLVGWVRSFGLAEFIGLPFSSPTYYFFSHDGLLEFQRTALRPDDSELPERPEFGPQILMLFADTIPPSKFRPTVIWGSAKLDWYRDTDLLRVGTVQMYWMDYPIDWQQGVGSLRVVYGDAGYHRAMKIEVPYWLVTIPLAILSAYLILWKPRKRA